MKFIIERTKLRSSSNSNTSYFKVAPSRRLKNLLKPLLRRVFPSRASLNANRNSYQASEEQDVAFEWIHYDLDNQANEALEQRLQDEVELSNDGDAIVVFDDEGKQHVKLIDKDHFNVPVCFASLGNGTFYWTSLQQEAPHPGNIQWHFMDRWAQA